MNALFKMSYITNFFKIKDVEGYENLQQRITDKKEYLEKIISIIKSLENSIKVCLNDVQNSNKSLENIKYSEEEKNLHDIIKLIYKKISNSFQDNLNLLNQINLHITKHKSNLDKEISYYEEFKKINKDLREEREKLNKNKDSYHKLGKKSENEIKKFAKNIPKIEDINQNEILQLELDNIAEPVKMALEDYRISLIKTNELIKKYNEKQSLLFRYLPDLSSEEGVFSFRLMKIYLQNLEKEDQFLNLNINQIKNNNSLETKTKLVELIELSEKTKKDEKFQKYIEYQTELDYNKCENENDFNLYANSIMLIKNFIDENIFPNYNYDDDIKRFRMSQIIKNLFKETGEIDTKLSENFFTLLNDPNIHKCVFIVLSQLRTSSKFLRTKHLIDLLGKAFNILLDTAGKNELYENVKNCIILSQTYYYNDENKNKVYIFEYIKNHKYFKNPKFWRNFIDNMIKKELIRFETVFPDTNFSVEKNINITNTIRAKLNEVVFSQLLTYASNLKDFNFDKRIILKIIDEFIEKYNYLSKNNINSLYEMISQGEADIEQLRKEYQDELINNEEENEKINNEKEEKHKEEKEEKQHEEEKKENNDNEKNNNNEINNENIEEKKE